MVEGIVVEVGIGASSMFYVFNSFLDGFAGRFMVTVLICFSKDYHVAFLLIVGLFESVRHELLRA